MGEKQTSSDPEILNLLNKIVCQNTDIKKDIEVIKRDLSAQSLKIDNINSKVGDLEKENLVLKNKLNTIERKFRRNNFIIFGVNEEVTDILSFITNIITEKLNITINRQDINNIYRVGQKAADKIRPILLELVTTLKKQEIFKELYNLKNTGIIFSNDLLPQDREEQKVLHQHLKLAKQKQYNAKIVNNNLIIEGDTYTYQDLLNKNRENIEHSKQHKNHSAPATPQTSTEFTYPTEEQQKHKNTEEGRKNQEEADTEKNILEGSKVRKNSVTTPGTSELSGPRNKRPNSAEEKEYITRSSKKTKT